MTAKYWAVVPAAGKGTRLGAALPKQYLTLAGAPIIVHTLNRLLAHPQIVGAVVALSPDDHYWQSLDYMHTKPVLCAQGGEERFVSVLNALLRLASHGAHADDWVLVHDAARPCVRLSDISKLIESVGDNVHGGLLGVPVADTLKRCDMTGIVTATVDRSALWRALTPQMFKLELLAHALQNLMRRGAAVTDDAAAMEREGYRPRMVEGHADNIKITRKEDLQLASLYLDMQGGNTCE
ncbi:MAG: 2-C-methyl-D-erythritol 4-phosphate cytidylyltransferase [Gammaproteobacteria bacterium]|nr:2-C-methyl-D-erythritol 4-phosphate cytidylyltransferase [Gammaproteobacteria bacterium]